MLALTDKPLLEKAQAGLTRYQKRVDAKPDYADRVVIAKKLFGQYNKPRNATFKVVRSTLAEMCNGPRRCTYCEDSVGDEVEHIKPKGLYPEVDFSWANYVYACGPCNGPKNSKFAVIDGATNQLVNVTRKRVDPIAPPRPGAPALIDPRHENPLDFLFLDIVDTFRFQPQLALNGPDLLRAEYTIELLGLNDRDYLRDARENAYGGFRARLHQYVDRRNAGDPAADLKPLVDDLKNSPHPTVWAEMKRSHASIPELVALFDQAAEALDW